MISSQDENEKNAALKRSLPPRSRPINGLIHANLNIPFCSDVVIEKVSMVKKNSKIDSLYHFKKYEKKSHIAELDGYCAMSCEYLASSRYVPSVHSYFNDEYEIVGVSSKHLPAFKSNREDPLTKEDTLLSNLNINIEWTERSLIFEIEKMLLLLDKNPTISSNYQFLYQTLYHTFFTTFGTVYAMRQYLLKFTQQKYNFSMQSLNELLSHIKQRLKNIHQSSTHALYSTEEMMILETMLEKVYQLQDLYISDNNDDDELNIEMLEFFDQYLINIDLEDRDFICVKIENEIKKISVIELEKYRILKGISTSLAARFINKEADLNNSNINKHGLMIDFDWTKSDILYEFKNHDIFNIFFRNPDENSFACHAYNLQYFPDIETNVCYWPTKQMDIHKIIIDILSKFLNDCQNLQTKNDNDIYHQITKLVLFLNNFYEQLNKKTLAQSLIDFIYRVTIKFKSLLSGRAEDEIIDKEKIQYLFMQFNQQLKNFIECYHISIQQFEENIANQYGNNNNKYSKEDNQLYKSLATHPVIIFHKYKTFLKYILTDIQFYHSLVELNIIKNQQVFYKNEVQYLHEILVESEQKRQQEFWNSLTHLPDFIDFIKTYGDTIFELLKEECVIYKEKYQRKLEQKPYYLDLVQAIDIEKMQAKYNWLCMELGVPTKFSKKMVVS